MKDFYVKVYLTNLGKYVEGYLVGKWVDVTSDTDWIEELFNAILDCNSDFDEAYEIAIDGNYTYYDDVDDEYDLGNTLVDEGFLGHIDDNLKMYLDYEKIGRDYMINVNGSFSSNGFVALY